MMIAHPGAAGLFGLISFVILFSPGCTADQSVDGGGQPQIEYDPPTLEELRAAHQSRLDAIEILESGGIIELTWTDQDGSHFEQADLLLLYASPQLLALRIYKFEDLFWIGSDTNRYWFFDLMDDERQVAMIGRYESLGSDGEFPTMLDPRLLLHLLGLGPLPAEGRVTHDSARDTWVVAGTFYGRMIVTHFDRTTSLPVHVEIYDAAGNVELRSDLDRYVALPVSGLPPGAFPRMPSRVVLRNETDDGQALIALDGLTGRTDRTRIERAANLDLLLDRFQPDEVRRLDGVSAQPLQRDTE